MSRKPTIQYEDVAPICKQLYLEGRDVTFNAVYAVLARGGAATVQKYIRQWREHTAKILGTPRVSAALPTEIVAIADQLLEAMWAQSLEQADAAYLAKHQELQAERIVWAERIGEAEVMADDLNRQLLTVRGELQAKDATIDAQSGSIDELRGQLAAATQALAKKEVEVQRYFGEVQSLKSTLASEREHHQAVLAAQQEQHLAAMSAETERHATDLARHLEIAQGERTHLMLQTDAMRQEIKQAQAAVNAARAESKEIEANLRNRANAAEEKLAEARGEAKATQNLVNEQKAHVDQLIGQLAVANNHNAEQARAIVALQAMVAELQANADKRMQGEAL